ncbi:MAG: EAL domain-containing protein [Aquimonas sp.]|nr:EAL domain-containing protein [Aquimonas sp.]
MQALWDRGEATAEDIIATVVTGHGRHNAGARNLINRVLNKGVIEARRTLPARPAGLHPLRAKAWRGQLLGCSADFSLAAPPFLLNRSAPDDLESTADEVRRLRAELAREQTLISLAASLAYRLVGATALDQVLAEVMQALGRACEVDRVYMFELRPPRADGRVLADQRLEWVAPGIEPQIDNPELEGLDAGAAFPRVLASITEDRTFKKHSEEFDASERAVLEPQGIQSLLIVPIMLDTHLWGFVGFDSVRERREFMLAEESVLKLIAASMGAAIERRRSEADLRRAVSVFESTRDSIAVADLEGRIISTNPALLRCSGYSREELLGRHWIDVFADDTQRERLLTEIESSLRSLGYWNGECTSHRRDSSSYPQWLSINAVRDGSGEARQFVLVGTDISPLKASEARLDYLAHHDMLTGLPNRRLAQSELERQLVAEAKPFAVLFIDLDRFKGVNDSLGHSVGDAMLIEAARRLRARLRGEDMLARLGGDEFLVVLRGVGDAREALSVAQGLCARLREPYLLGERKLFASASIGLSLYPVHGSSVELLMQRADLAMYRAKHEGRDRVSVFSEELGEAARRALELEALLRRALEQGELTLHYQPRICLRSGRIVGAEALLRVAGPDGAHLPTAELVELAEAVGLIVPIGRWVLEQACLQMALWRMKGLPSVQVSVNVSAQQFYAGDLIEIVDAALARHGLPAAMLELELTESVLMQDPDAASRALEDIGARGIGRALDDFGSGYSSLSYLLRFPVDRLKVDRVFVASVPADARAAAIVATTAELARRLGISMVAEGVETGAQLEFLRAEGVPEAQGWLFSRAVDADAFAALLARQAGGDVYPGA